MTPPSCPRAGLYARQSAGNQASVAEQDRTNTAACEREGWDVVARYSDLVSAARFSKKRRSGWDQLVADVVAGKLDIVVLRDPSRGDRTVATWADFVEQCRARGILIHATAHRRTYDPRLPRDWKSLLEDGVEAGHSSEEKSRLVCGGITQAAMDGKPHGGSGYGYTRNYNKHDRKVFNEMPNDNAPVVREIIERCAREEPLRHIINDLNARGVPSPKGGLWTSRVVKTIATHPRYIGKRRHQGELHPASWAAIVDEDVFNRAVAVLTAPNRKGSAPASKKYLLSYLLAAPCKGLLNAQPPEPSRPARYRCNEDGCTSIRAEDLDTFITDVILERLALPDARGFFAPPTEESEAAHSEVARLKKRLDEARESFYSDDGISLTAFAGLERELTPKVAKAQQRVADLATCAAGLELLGTGKFTVQVGRPRWEELPLAGKRSVVKALFDKIEIGPAERVLTRWSTEAERLEAVTERTAIAWKTAP
jgi:site-specific DNA recombinase